MWMDLFKLAPAKQALHVPGAAGQAAQPTS
jgi:hypothetical protein